MKAIVFQHEYDPSNIDEVVDQFALPQLSVFPKKSTLIKNVAGIWHFGLSNEQLKMINIILNFRKFIPINNEINKFVLNWGKESLHLP